MLGNLITKMLRVPFADDLHCHLRQGDMMSLVTPLIRQGVTSCKQAGEYRKQLMDIEPKVDFLMTLYLSHKISIDDLRENAVINHVQGIKCYPVGMTTNSDHGFKSIEEFYPLFNEMERMGLSLHVHGERPGSSPLSSEADFINHVEGVSKAFPKLKVVAEHVSTKASLEAIGRIPNLAASVTPHHLFLITEDVLEHTEGITQENIVQHVKNPHLYCKPLAQGPDDREALLEAVRSRSSKIFLGSDSAPHTIEAKMSGKPPAGIFTQPFVMNYLATVFNQLGRLDYLEEFACRNGSRFLGLPEKEPEWIEVLDETMVVPSDINGVIMPFLAGKQIVKIRC
ncbi:putative dihydroorotase [Babesia sp. Xinjiang]|uniref:putative dihydroorotase n=1 Tax=Babesia sp. Xinjiang TaxID=462227 RepID=UPI000A249D25|nr:putative dihydroorotase [Babesia sp. Xinjiang]ORM40043.1 putative dihydroorotase [Babesia sp. Xinjiang]